MLIRRAEEQEFERVRSFYHDLIDAMEGSEFYIGWEKDVYPSRELLADSINAGELFIGEVECAAGGRTGDYAGNSDACDSEAGEQRIVCAMILNHEWNECYDQCQWPIEAVRDEILVIHALGVHPDFAGKGYAKALVREAIEIAEIGSQRVIRLDVLSGNTPALRLYEGMGFEFVEHMRMFYEDTGWTDFDLYEYVV